MFGFFKEIESDIARLLPGFGHEAGALEAAIVKNIAHDVAALGGEARALVAADIAAIWKRVVAAVRQELDDPRLAQEAYDLKIGAAVTQLGAVAWRSVAPAVPGIAQATLETLARAAGAMVMAGLVAAL